MPTGAIARDGSRGAVTPVAVSSFAAQHRRGESITENFRAATQMWTGVAWPFFGLVCVLAAPTIHILFGSGWDKAIPILRLYCIAAAISALTSLNWNAYQAMGAVSNLLKIQLVVQPLKVVLVMVASFISLIAVGYALIAAALISVVAAYVHANRLFDTSLGGALRASAKSFGVTACAVAVPLCVTLSRGPDVSYLWLVLVVAGAGAGWFVGLWLLHHALWPEVVLVCDTVRRRIVPWRPERRA